VEETTQNTDAKTLTLLRLACFVACIPSVGALLAKVYGVTTMRLATLAVAIPCCAGLVAAWVWARNHNQQLKDALEIGFVAGLLGTLAYDLSRLPFSLAGQRIFAPISAYGVWILDASVSSRFTEITGWLYHFSNGLTFGIMYALFMWRGHWGWGIVWGLMLETIALLTPFAKIFGISSNPTAIGIAYFGHFFYGLPVGWLVYKWNETRDQLRATPNSYKIMTFVLACVPVAWTAFSAGNVRRDAQVVQGEFRVEGQRLNPDWLRIERGQQITVYSPENDVSVHLKQTNLTKPIKGGQRDSFSFPETGIYQMFVETNRRTQSSFVIVEPVERK
jgi:hypothetical protein